MSMEWYDIDLAKSNEELKKTITRSTYNAIKLSHPDDYHLYVLEKYLTTDHEPAKRAWRGILDLIQQEESKNE